MRQKEHEVAARFQRYGRFGMRLEEARLPTPEHYRTAYDELVEAITPSPSPESVADSTRDSRKVIETGRNLKRKGTTNAGMYHAIQARLRYLADDFSACSPQLLSL